MEWRREIPKTIAEATAPPSILDWENGSFINGWNAIAKRTHYNAKEKGFWDQERNDSEMIMLIVTELAEAVEALRHGNPSDDKIPAFLGTEAELADAVIRLMDLGHARGWRVAEAVLAKMTFNSQRERMHGKAF